MADSTQKPDKSRYNNWSMIKLASEMAFIIAIPAVAMSILGQKLDDAWGTNPLVTLVGIVLALTFSIYSISRKVMAYTKR